MVVLNSCAMEYSCFDSDTRDLVHARVFYVNDDVAIIAGLDPALGYERVVGLMLIFDEESSFINYFKDDDGFDRFLYNESILQHYALGNTPGDLPIDTEVITLASDGFGGPEGLILYNLYATITTGTHSSRIIDFWFNDFVILETILNELKSYWLVNCTHGMRFTWHTLYDGAHPVINGDDTVEEEAEHPVSDDSSYSREF